MPFVVTGSSGGTYTSTTSTPSGSLYSHHIIQGTTNQSTAVTMAAMNAAWQQHIASQMGAQQAALNQQALRQGIANHIASGNIPNPHQAAWYGDVDEDGNPSDYPSQSLFRNIPKGTGGGTINLPNGAVLTIDANDDITLSDTDAKVIYKAPTTRLFNPYLNASDLMEEFIRYCDTQKVKRDEFMELPINLFIYWLIVRAAERDKEDDTDARTQLTLTLDKKKNLSHRCRSCGKFIPHRFEKASVFFCTPEHMSRQLEKLAA